MMNNVVLDSTSYLIFFCFVFPVRESGDFAAT